MPRNFFITGQPKAGKTTLLKDLVKELRKKGIRVGGFISPDERHHGTRTAFRVLDLETGKTAMLASVDGDGPKVSKYHVDIRSFESIALPALGRSGKCDVIVIDEIGLMELKSRKFSDALEALLDSDTHLIATLHGDLVDKYAGDGEVLELDRLNRGAVYGRLLQEAKESLTKKPEAPERPKKEKKAPKKAKAEPKKETRAKEGKGQKKEAKKPAKKAEKKKEMPPQKKVEMEEVALQEEPQEKERQKEPEKKGGLLDRIKRLFSS